MADLSRPLLVVVGVAVLAGAFFLARTVAESGDDAPVTGTGSESGESTRQEKDDAPVWEDFLVATSDEIPRPTVVADDPPASPFDRGFARMRLGELNLRLEGIGRGGEAGAVALVSGTRVRVGDVIDVFRVVSIRTAAVSLEGPSGVRIDLVPRPPDPETDEEPATGDDVLADWEKAFEATQKRGATSEPARAFDREDVR